MFGYTLGRELTDVGVRVLAIANIMMFMTMMVMPLAALAVSAILRMIIATPMMIILIMIVL